MTLPRIALALALGANAAAADSIKIVTRVEVAGQIVESSNAIGFRPSSNVMFFNVAGKTCIFGTSLQGSVPGGCNYTVLVAGNDVSISGGGPICRRAPVTCQ